MLSSVIVLIELKYQEVCRIDVQQDINQQCTIADHIDAPYGFIAL